MIASTKQATLNEFEALIKSPENANRQFELIGGEIVEVVTSPMASKIAGRILAYINLYLMTHDIGHTTTADGGYQIGDQRYMPDAAFISYERHPQELPYDVGFYDITPDLVVEVVSRNDSAKDLSVKISSYLALGIVVWVAHPQEQTVVVHAPNTLPRVLTMTDTLDGGTILPDFSLPVERIFATRNAPDS